MLRFTSRSGNVVELVGDDPGPPIADRAGNGYRVEQHDRHDRARDQRWMLIK